MQGEQLEIMKVIQFPKNRQYKLNQKNRKLNVAIRMLEVLSEHDIEFHIVVNKKAALILFDDTEGKMRDYLFISSSYEESKNIKLNSENSRVYEIDGDELD